MQPLNLVAFTGPAGSGKSTAADTLCEAGWVRVKMAGTLKDMAACFLRAAGVEDVQACLDGAMKETPLPQIGGRTPRHVMQTLGSEWGRDQIAASIWVDLARAECLRLMAAGHRVVIDDVRFENEAQMVRELGGAVVGVSGRAAHVGAHASEAGIDADWRIPNNGSRGAFVGAIHYIFLCSDGVGF